MQKAPPFLSLISQGNDFNLIFSSLSAKDEHLIYGLTGVQKTIVAATVVNKKNTNMLIMCDSPKRAKEVWDDLSYLLPHYNVLYFPALEVIPFEVFAKVRRFKGRTAGSGHSCPRPETDCCCSH